MNSNKDRGITIYDVNGDLITIPPGYIERYVGETIPDGWREFTDKEYKSGYSSLIGIVPRDKAHAEHLNKSYHKTLLGIFTEKVIVKL